MIDRDYVINALLRLQYFPSVKKAGDELPPIFSSSTFSDVAAKDLGAIFRGGRRWVEFRTRRFDGLVRRLKLPHPVTYSRLVTHIGDNWNQIQNMLDSGKSKIQPEWHSDGRIIQMDYADSLEEHAEDSTYAHGKKFKVSTDISNFFPSVYSHGIDWALRTKSVAKRDRSKKSWEAQLDLFSSNCMHGETNGLPIGPAASNIISEIILQNIDRRFSDVHFVRHIDDYTAYFDTLDDAEVFISRLQSEVAEYGLDLNTRKTQIEYLGDGHTDNWLAEILTSIQLGGDDLTVVRMLQHSEALSAKNKSKSVLKFALKLLLHDGQRDETYSLPVVNELIRICYFHPHILSILSSEFNKIPNSIDLSDFAAPLCEQVQAASRRHESDAVLWLMHILVRRIGCIPGTDLVQDILAMNDPLAMVGLSVLAPSHDHAIADKLRKIQYDDDYDYDDYWLARYQLNLSGALSPWDLTDFEKRWMNTLKGHGVTFVA